MLWPKFGGGFQSFHTSPQSRSYPCLMRMVPYCLDPGARCMVYLQPQERMVPSKIPVQISIQNITFFFSQVSTQKGSSESSFGPTKGVPQNDFMFVPLPRFSQVQYSCKTLKMLTATNMDPQNKGFVFLSQKLDDGWPESVEEQGLLLLVWRHHITKHYIKDVL